MDKTYSLQTSDIYPIHWGPEQGFQSSSWARIWVWIEGNKRLGRAGSRCRVIRDSDGVEVTLGPDGPFEPLPPPPQRKTRRKSWE
jgi:hypothetical protein